MVTTLFIDFSDAQGQLTPKSVMESGQNSTLSKFLLLSLLPARMKKIHPKMKPLQWSQHVFHYKSMGIFQDDQGQLTPQSKIWSGPNFKPIQDFMVFLVTCKNKENRIKNNGARVVTRIFIYFSNPQGQLTQ